MTTLHTARLLLRPFLPSDIAAYGRIRAKPEAVRHLPGGTARAADAAATAAHLVSLFEAQWTGLGYGPWAAVDRASGDLLGHLGLRFVPEFQETELLYMLDPAVWGRGLATEGCVAACDFAFEVPRLPRLLALVVPENRASIRVVEKLGMRVEGTVAFMDLRCARFELSADEWRARRAGR